MLRPVAFAAAGVRVTGREHLAALPPPRPERMPHPQPPYDRLPATWRPIMKRAIIYLQPEHPTSYETVERANLAADGYDVRTRNSRQFSGVPDPCELCVTDVAAIAEAYESAATEVRGFSVKADDAPAGKPEPTTEAEKAADYAARARAEVLGTDADGFAIDGAADESASGAKKAKK